MKSTEHQKKKLELHYNLAKLKRARKIYLAQVVLLTLIFLVLFLGLFVTGILLSAFGLIPSGAAFGMVAGGFVISAMEGFASLCFLEHRQVSKERIHQQQHWIDLHNIIPIEYEELK